MVPSPQFTSEVTFHFKEHDQNRRHWFMFGNDCKRLVPMRMDGVDSLNTLGMWAESPGTFSVGEKILVRCRVIAPELFKEIVRPGVKFELWDGGFFATGVVIERFEDGWL